MANRNVTGFGKTREGKEAHLYVLENKNGLKAYVSDFGASLVRLLVPDKDGTMLDVVHGYDDAVGYEKYDIVAANILADVLVELTPVIVHQLKKGGIYITSGIIDDKEQTVTDAVRKAGLELLDVTYQGEWVCVTARKP